MQSHKDKINAYARDSLMKNKDNLIKGYRYSTNYNESMKAFCCQKD